MGSTLSRVLVLQVFAQPAPADASDLPEAGRGGREEVALLFPRTTLVLCSCGARGAQHTKPRSLSLRKSPRGDLGAGDTQICLVPEVSGFRRHPLNPPGYTPNPGWCNPSFRPPLAVEKFHSWT